MKYQILFIIFLVVAASCSSNKKIVVNEKQETTLCDEMILLSKPIDSLRMDHYTIDSLRIKDQCLEMVVSYGGGCGDAMFELYYTNHIMESMPPQAILYLSFTDNDPCRSIVTKKLKFNLSPYQKYYDRGGIYFKIADTDKSILYQLPK